MKIKGYAYTALALLMTLANISAQATINCAGTLPNRYFERVDFEHNKNVLPFAGKLIDTGNDTQQLQNSAGKVVIGGLSDAHVLMDKYVLAKKNGKFGVIDGTGKVIVPFAYDDIQSEPDIATSFIVSEDTDNTGITKQGIISRDGDWIYPLSAAQIKHAHYDPDYDQDFFIVTQNDHSGLLDDRGYWAIWPEYAALHPLNACTGMSLYIRAIRHNSHALLDQHGEVIVAFAPNQHIEWFGARDNSSLFLRSILIDDQKINHMSEDMADNIVNAQLIDASGKMVLTSDTPIIKLLYHQLYVYQQAGKFGVIDGQGGIILEPQFDGYEDKGDQVWLNKNGEKRRLDQLIKMN